MFDKLPTVLINIINEYSKNPDITDIELFLHKLQKYYNNNYGFYYNYKKYPQNIIYSHKIIYNVYNYYNLNYINFIIEIYGDIIIKTYRNNIGNIY